MKKTLFPIMAVLCCVSLFGCGTDGSPSNSLEVFSSVPTTIQMSIPTTFNTEETLSVYTTEPQLQPVESEQIETEPLETLPPETEPPVTQPPATPPPETQPPETQPPETQPPETQPPETQPTEPPLPQRVTLETQPPVVSDSAIPVFQNQKVDFYVTVVAPDATARSGAGAECRALYSVAFGSNPHISAIHGTLDNLWGYLDGGWICMDDTNFYVNEAIYMEYVSAMDIFSNTANNALPITLIQKLVTEHFAAPLPEGKTAKKAIVIGYDGFRTDGLDMIKDMPNSGIMHLRQQGGVYHAFTGGIKGMNEQLTITAPSWMSATTGGWDEYHGVSDNDTEKNSVKTFLTTLSEQDYSTAMVVSWPTHIQVSFRPDVQYAVENLLPAQYICATCDDDTLHMLHAFVTKQPDTPKLPEEDPDVIFTVLEYTDAVGHSVGYGNYVEEYIHACKSVDEKGYELIQAIEARDTFVQEDWLILIATDHGGIVNGHGSQMAFDRMIWIASNQMIEINDENLNYALYPRSGDEPIE